MGFPTNNVFNVPGFAQDQATTQKAFQDAMTAAQQRTTAQNQNALQAALQQGQLAANNRQISNQFTLGQAGAANQAAEIANQKALGQLGYQTQQNIANTQGEYGLKQTSAQGDINKLLAAIQNQGSLDVAKQQGQTQLGVAGLTTQSAQDIARLQATNALQQLQLGGQNTLSQIGAQGDISKALAAAQQASQERIAGQQTGTQLQLGQLSAKTQEEINREQLANALQLGQLGSQTQLGITGLTTQSNKDIANLNNTNALALGAQQGGFQTQIAAGSNAAQIRQAEIAAQAAGIPAQLQQQRFNQVLPFLTGAFGGGGGGGGGGGYSFGGSGGTGGGFDFTSGNLGASGMSVSPALEQANVNRARSINDQTVSQDIQRVPQGFTGRGWSGTNPASLGRAAQLQAAGLQTGTDAELQQRNAAVQANTDAALKNRAIQGQLAGAQIGAGASRYAADVGAGASNKNALLAALSNLV